MAKYLDLTVFQEETFEVRLSEEETLHVKKPSQRLVIDLMNYEKEFNNKKVELCYSKVQGVKNLSKAFGNEQWK